MIPKTDFNPNTIYKYGKQKTFKYPKTNIFFHEIDNLLIDNNKTITKKEGLYFPIRYNANYSLLLWDYVGAYFKIKEIYNNIVPIFFNFTNRNHDTKVWSNVPKDIVKFLNAEVIDIDKESFLFEKVVLIEGDVPPIPLGEYSSDLWRYSDLSEETILWWITTAKEVVKNFKPQNILNKQNSYISRSKVNERYKELKTDWHLARFQNSEYNENLDKKISDLGFNVIDFLGMGLFEQIDCAYSSKTYASIHGSGLINALWCDDEVPILSFQINSKYKQYNFDWKSILNAFNKDLTIINLDNLSPSDGADAIVNILKDFKK